MLAAHNHIYCTLTDCCSSSGPSNVLQRFAEWHQTSWCMSNALIDLLIGETRHMALHEKIVQRLQQWIPSPVWNNNEIIAILHFCVGSGWHWSTCGCIERELMVTGVSDPSPAAIQKAISREELVCQCKWKTRGANKTITLIEALLLGMTMFSVIDCLLMIWWTSGRSRRSMVYVCKILQMCHCTLTSVASPREVSHCQCCIVPEDRLNGMSSLGKVWSVNTNIMNSCNEFEVYSGTSANDVHYQANLLGIKR